MAQLSSEKDHLRWLAVSQRDPAANSSFLYGVTSTSIFCRPTCPGRVARRANVVFFDTLYDALESGYRPCKRCKPHQRDWCRISQQQLIGQRARELIVIAVVQGVPWTVRDIAKNLNVSGAHLHRQFKKCHGCSPKAFAAVCQRATRGILQSSYESTSLIDEQCLTSESSQSYCDEWLPPSELAAIDPIAIPSEAINDGGLSRYEPLAFSGDESVFVDDLELDMIPGFLESFIHVPVLLD